INDSKTENLIIDLRNNGGGDPYAGSYLMQYIANKPFSYFHQDVRMYSALKKTIQPKPNRFKSKPYILTNGYCFSTTGHFSSIVRENNFGIFVGDETGATYTCNDNSKGITLKNTKLSINLPRNTYYTTASTLTNEHGIIPDHYVLPDIKSILSNTDTVLNYTLKRIENE
ncbi:MAG: S41 family peptidase, partial [Cyclobacteriaceae bacterium]|nr:S41 family peptidase [Cyclobacteriaceae bacterium]